MDLVLAAARLETGLRGDMAACADAVGLAQAIS
jgi:hypothetical protein